VAYGKSLGDGAILRTAIAEFPSADGWGGVLHTPTPAHRGSTLPVRRVVKRTLELRKHAMRVSRKRGLGIIVDPMRRVIVGLEQTYGFIRQIIHAMLEDCAHQAAGWY
jgi:hypothetical protein